MTSAPPSLTLLPVDGATVAHTELGGTGPAVLLLHAGVFGAWFDRLAEEPALDAHRVLLVRRAGYVAGHPPSTALSIGDHAAHAAAVLEALDTGPAHVVGHSSASAIALQLAVDRPDLVRSLVLGEPPLIDALADPADLDMLREAVGPAIGGAVAAAAAGDVRSAYDGFMGAVCGPEHRAVVGHHLGADGLARAEAESAAFFADEVGAVARWQFPPEAAAAVTAPTLLVQGGASPPPVHRLVAHLAAALPHADVATIAGADHLLPLRSAPALAALVAAHVAAAEATRAPDPG